MIVSRDRFPEVIAHLEQTGQYGLDTETTGLKTEDRVFSVIICDGLTSYYFNFNQHCDHQGALAPLTHRLDALHYRELQRVFSNPDSVWFIHNAKFDLGMLAKDGFVIAGRVHCTYAIERVIKNNHLGGRPYSLDALAKRIGMKKDKEVDKYITKYKLYKVERVPGKTQPKKLKQFHKVPFNTISTYGMQDARLHYEIGVRQNVVLQGLPELSPVVENELRLLHTCLDMERTGIKIDRPYAERALVHEQAALEKLKREFQVMTDLEFSESPRLLSESLRRAGESVPLTEKGNPRLDKKSLALMKSPVAQMIQRIRAHSKFISTYYSSILYYADSQDELHPGINQAGAETGRMSMSEPSLHNVPKEEEGEFKVRRCFVPREPYIFFMLDYNQQEFRMMLDYAGEADLIDAINQGVDVHQATADLCGITRKQAKTINFGLLYGMGVGKLSDSLGMTLPEAMDLKRLYFSKLPRVKQFIYTVGDRGKARGYIFNWMGRRCHIDSPEESYILPNHLIQGGCADVCKVAMNRVHDFLKDKRSRLILQVHDELLFEIHPEEFDLVSDIKSIMEQVYVPRSNLKLTCSIEHSRLSWSDKVVGMPDGHRI